MAAIRVVGFGLVAAAGIAGVLQDLGPAPAPLFDLHAAFGALLLSMVVVYFREPLQGAQLTHAQARGLCRQSSRAVYALLYVVFGADQVARISSNAVFLQPPENLRAYLGYGLVALLAIRAMTVLSVRRPPALRMNPQLARAEDAVAPR